MSSRKDDLKSAITAVQFGDIQTIRQMVNTQNISPNTADDDGCTLLHWAAINNRNALLVYLIEHGAQVNVLGGVLMESPLHWAVRKNYFRTVKLLLQNGADTALQSKDGVSPLLLACTLGNLEMAYFLIAHGADVNGLNNVGDSLLMTLLKEQECGKLDIFRLILKLGADPTFRDRQDGNTILHVMNTRRTKEHFKLAFVLYDAAGPEVLKVKNFHDKTPRDIVESDRNYLMMRFYSDYYQYVNWNKHIPAIASATSFILLPTLIELIGWIYGTIVYFVIQSILLDKIMCMTIEFSYSKINQGATWGVILSLFFIFVKELQPYVHTNTCAFVYFNFITICVLNIILTNSPPLYVETGEDRPALLTAMVNSSPLEGPLPTNPRDKENDVQTNEQLAELNHPEIMDRGLENLLPSVSLREDEETALRKKKKQFDHDEEKAEVTQLDLAPEVKLCPTCLVDKNLHSTHCKVCNKCLTKDFEHHCSYVNNCIGEDNRRVFVFFLIACFIGITTFTYLAVSIDTYVLCHNKEKYWFEWYYSIQKCMAKDYKALDLLSHIAVLLWMWLLSITYAQCAMVAFETTTFELMNDNDDKECIPYEQIQRNVCEFIKTGKYRVTRKVNRGRPERWGSIVEDERQSLLQDFEPSAHHGRNCSHDHNHSHSHDHSHSAHTSTNAKMKISKYGTRFRMGSFDVEDHEHNV